MGIPQKRLLLTQVINSILRSVRQFSLVSCKNFSFRTSASNLTEHVWRSWSNGWDSKAMNGILTYVRMACYEYMAVPSASTSSPLQNSQDSHTFNHNWAWCTWSKHGWTILIVFQWWKNRWSLICGAHWLHLRTGHGNWEISFLTLGEVIFQFHHSTFLECLSFPTCS